MTNPRPDQWSSVTRQARPAEALVDARSDDIEVTADAVGRGNPGGGSRKARSPTIEEDVIMIHANRPIGSGNRYSTPAPTVAPHRVSLLELINALVAVEGLGVATLRHGRAALRMEQHVVPSPTDLAREKTEHPP